MTLHSVSLLHPGGATFTDWTHQCVQLRDAIVRSGRQTICAMRGHDQLLHFAADRMCLRCASCGRQTAGWGIGRPKRRDAMPRT